MTNQDTEKDQPPSSFLNKIKRFLQLSHQAWMMYLYCLKMPLVQD